jgi:diguanylate cyclase (GGDEF)-like protein
MKLETFPSEINARSARMGTLRCEGRIGNDLAVGLAEAAALAGNQAPAIAHIKQLYDRASTLAGIGVWECRLDDEALTWTDGVYDLFELPRNCPVNRSSIVNLYEPSSRREMERLRAHAIHTRSSFTLDARVRTARGNERWMRLTAGVECDTGRPARIFGVKQDITAEKALWEQMRRLAECDPLTGLPNRGVFQSTFWDRPAGGASREPLAALLLIDIDGFKHINDTFGHSAGDECLRNIAARLDWAYEQALLLARIGGDEFAVMIAAPTDRAAIENLTRKILQDLQAPVVWLGQSFRISGSAGIAIPDETADYDAAQLFAQADAALYAAKAAGRNTFRIFRPDGS